MTITRRHLLAALPAATLATTTPLRAAPRPLRTYRMVLNSGWSGVNAWFVLAQDRGYLRDEGLDIEFTAGKGAYTAAQRMAAEGFDIGYGDINSLIEVAANGAPSAPKPTGVFMMFDQSPSVIVVAADGPIRTPADLKGRTIAGHPTDVALCTFPPYARAVGLDPASVTIARTDPNDAGMVALMNDMLAGKSDGVFGYYTTQYAGALTTGIDPARLRFLRYDAALPDVYGSAIMASAAMLKSHPDDVKRIVRAFNRGVMDCVRDPAAAVEAVMRREPELKRDIELTRLSETLRHEMNHPERARIGIGDADDARLGRAIAAMVETKSLPRTPATAAIFTRAFLPPLGQRLRNMVRA